VGYKGGNGGLAMIFDALSCGVHFVVEIARMVDSSSHLDSSHGRSHLFFVWPELDAESEMWT
jgi:hypothetical protein